jgi:hypothetical protein
MTTFRNHCEWVYGFGSSANLLTAAQIESLQGTIYSNRAFSDDNLTVMEKEKDLILYYATNCKKIFRVSPTYNGFNHDDFSTVPLAEAQFIVTLQQNVLTYCFGEAELSAYPSYFAGFAFDCAKHFPGDVAAPADPNAIYSVQINASQPKAWGYDVLWSNDPAKRATGAYLAPGSVGTVIVSPALINQGYVVRVGAQIHFKGGDDGGNTDSYSMAPWSGFYKTKMERMDGVTRVYAITSTETKIANPLGGNIYIEVPSEAANGIVTVQFKNTVRAPFFSKLPWRQTTLSQWQTTERTHPGAFADFESEKSMFTIPRNWIYNFNAPVTMMSNWDSAMDAISYVQGLPLIRNKTVFYGIVDTSFKTGAGSPGYPQSNDNFNPTVSKSGNNAGHHYLYGPKFVDSLHLHELGHGITITKFAGENEAMANFPYVPVHNMKFGVDLDEAFGRSFGDYDTRTVSRDQAALMWILDPLFRAGNYMTDAEMKYQHRGWGKYVEIAGLFGWEALHNFWYSEALDEQASGDIYDHSPGVYSNATSDNRILRMSRGAGVDLTPLLHIWGVRPYNTTTLKAAMLAEGLLPSAAIYDRIERYRNIVPHDQAAFDAHALAVSSAGRDTAWYTAQKNSYDLSVGTGAVAKVQQILDLHFPNGRPGSAPPDNSVIYSENFNGGATALNAKPPTTGGGAWIANPIATANGILTADAGSAVLRFDPLLNKIYTVSLDFNYSSGSGGWFGLGFASVSPWITSTASTADRFSNMNAPGHAWMLTGGSSMVGVWEGPKTTNTIPFTNPTLAAGPHTMKIIINTTGTGSSFTADFLMDGISITGGPKVVDTITLNDLNYVGFTQYGGGLLTGSTVDNFSVSTGVAPRPPTLDYNYTETFSGTSAPLNGKAPTTGSGAWSANSIVTDDGVLTASPGSALLPLTPEVNKRYTLSMDFNYSSGTGGWLGLGFAGSTVVSAPGASSSNDRFSNVNVPGYSWMNFKGTSFDLWQGPRAATAIPYNTTVLADGSHHLKVVLDTTGSGSSFNASFFVDGASVTSAPATINLPISTIKSAGFTQYGGGLLTGSTVDNFSLVTTSTPLFEIWASSFGLSGNNADPLFDYDGDGLNNLLEYAQNGSPVNASNCGTLPTGKMAEDEEGTRWFEFVHMERASNDSGLTYTLDKSTDLTNGSFDICADAVFVGETVVGEYKTVTHRIPTDGKTTEFIGGATVNGPVS